jgi:hypothetical protein
VLDGVYVSGAGTSQFRRVTPPTPAEREALLGRITRRIARHLERRGLLVRDAESSYLELGTGEVGAPERLLGALHHLPHRGRPERATQGVHAADSHSGSDAAGRP